MISAGMLSCCCGALAACLHKLFDGQQSGMAWMHSYVTVLLYRAAAGVAFRFVIAYAQVTCLCYETDD